MNSVFLILGSNEGNRLEQLSLARNEISLQIGAILLASPIYETAAWGNEDLPAHLNQVIQVETTLDPLSILEIILSIEQKLGRVRYEKWGMRLIDIDILFYNHDIITLPSLIIPHPQIQHRRFTLVPLHAIAAEYVHPVLDQSISNLLFQCEDPLIVKEFTKILKN